MAYSLVRTLSNNANVIVASVSDAEAAIVAVDIEVDYTDQFRQAISILGALSTTHNTISNTLSTISNTLSNIHTTLSNVDIKLGDIRDDIRVLKIRGSTLDLGIVVTTSNTDCWVNTCLYDKSLIEMALRDGNLLPKYNEIVVKNGGTPV